MTPFRLCLFSLCFALCSLVATAQETETGNRNALGLYLGFGTTNDFTQHFYQPWSIDFTSSRLIALNYRYEIADLTDHLQLEAEGVIGYRFGEGDSLVDIAAALGLRWTLFPWNDTLPTSFAIYIGPSWVSRIPAREAINAEDNATRLLNYFTPEFAFKTSEEARVEMFVRIHHRSGAFKAINGVTGASNILAIGVRRTF